MEFGKIVKTVCFGGEVISVLDMLSLTQCNSEKIVTVGNCNPSQHSFDIVPVNADSESYVAYR